MDFQLYGRVLRRFRVLIVAGLALAILLTALSVVRVTTAGGLHVGYRQSEQWSSTTRLGVTQSGFPWGRLLASPTNITGSNGKTKIPIADPNRLNALTYLYAELATSDPVRRLMLRGGPIKGKIVATPLVAGDVRFLLPLLDVTAISSSRHEAIVLAGRTATALQSYIADQQTANKVPASDRVVLQQVFRPKTPEVFKPRSKTMPVFIFLAVMFATFGLAFILEKMRPAHVELVDLSSGTQRQSA